MLMFKRLLLSAAAFALVPFHADAQNYPSRAITIVVPYAAGTGIDAMGRTLANALNKTLAQPVVVENRPGAGTNLGGAYVSRAKPDGYTLFFGANSAMAANQSLYANVGYDPQNDLAPVAFLGRGSMVVLANPDSGVKDMAGLLAYAKVNPSKANFGAANTTARVWIELIKSMTGIQAETINYVNAGTMLKDLMGGQIAFAVENTGTSRPFIDGRKVVPLAVTSKNRGRFNANVPTLTEGGFGSFEVDTWYGIYTPRGTPHDVVRKLHNEINALWKKEEFVRSVEFIELSDAGGSLDTFTKFQAAEVVKWKGLVERTGIRLD